MSVGAALRSDQRRVMLVAPEFPPSNTAGAHRPRLFAKHLPEFGWTPTVFTIKREEIEGPLDPMLEQLVDPELDVVRTGALPIRPIRLIGDIGIRSLGHHASALGAAHAAAACDATVLFGPPWFSFVLGPLMRRRCRHALRRGLHRSVDVGLDRLACRFPARRGSTIARRSRSSPTVLRSAAHVTAVSEGILHGPARALSVARSARG